MHTKLETITKRDGKDSVRSFWISVSYCRKEIEGSNITPEPEKRNLGGSWPTDYLLLCSSLLASTALEREWQCEALLGLNPWSAISKLWLGFNPEFLLVCSEDHNAYLRGIVKIRTNLYKAASISTWHKGAVSKWYTQLHTATHTHTYTPLRVDPRHLLSIPVRLSKPARRTNSKPLGGSRWHSRDGRNNNNNKKPKKFSYLKGRFTF